MKRPNRLNILLKASHRTQVERLVGRVGDSQAEVFRKALAVASIILREQDAGNELAFVRDGKVVKQWVGVWELVA